MKEFRVYVSNGTYVPLLGLEHSLYVDPRGILWVSNMDGTEPAVFAPGIWLYAGVVTGVEVPE